VPRLRRPSRFQLSLINSVYFEPWCGLRPTITAFLMDALADLVIAVDEAATTLVSHARRSSALVCTFDAVTSPSRLRVILAATTSSPVDASTSSFGWLVLRTLVDDVMLEQTPAAAPTGDRSVTITLEKALPAS